MNDQVVLKLPQQSFHKKRSVLGVPKVSGDGKSREINGTPWIINFRNFVSSKKQPAEVIPGITNSDLLHAVAGIYDKALPDVTEDIIYSTICEKFAKTILIVQDPDETLEEFKQRALLSSHDEVKQKYSHENSFMECENPATSSSDKNNDAENSVATSLTTPVNDNQETVQESGRFTDVFSDMESSDEDDDEEEEEDFMNGVDNFISNVKERKHNKELWLNSIKSNDCAGEPKDLIGIEHRLIGCLTFDRVYPKPGHKVIHLTLIAVRKRFRKMGVGRLLTQLVRDPAIVGKFDAILVNADHKATEFFEKEGFSSDVILNSKYEEIGDTWYNCKRMCYFPPYQSAWTPVLNKDDPIIPSDYYSELEMLDLKQMELDLSLYQEKSLQAFQHQALIVERLRKEVVLVRAKVVSQQDTIEALKKENYAIREEKYNCEKEYLTLKLKYLTSVAEDLVIVDDNFENEIPVESTDG